MNKSVLIAVREYKERIKARSFLLMAILGPLLVLGLVFILFAVGGSQKKHISVLVMDPYEILEGKIMPKEDPSVSYDIINDYVDFEPFANQNEYQKYDLGIEINEQVVKNKTVKVLYREKPNSKTEIKLRLHIERRLEEIMVKEFTTLSVQKFRAVKQPINFKFFDTYDPKEEEDNLAGWSGFFFGAIIILFIFLFGMTILRGVSQEKSNRIIEVLLASASPKQLLIGKVFGIGITALFQFLIWIVVIGVGLFFLRETLFPDVFDPSNMSFQQMSKEVARLTQSRLELNARDYNAFVELVYSSIRFENMLPFFLLFFVGGYVFYGSFFSAIGSSIGSESDGQQFIIPILFLLVLSLFSGYYAIYFPSNGLTTVFSYLPFTSPVVMLVKLGQGFSANQSWHIYLSLLTLLLAALFMFWIAGKIYSNGILQFGHRLRVKHLFKWLKKP